MFRWAYGPSSSKDKFEPEEGLILWANLMVEFLMGMAAPSGILLAMLEWLPRLRAVAAMLSFISSCSKKTWAQYKWIPLKNTYIIPVLRGLLPRMVELGIFCYFWRLEQCILFLLGRDCPGLFRKGMCTSRLWVCHPLMIKFNYYCFCFGFFQS